MTILLCPCGGFRLMEICLFGLFTLIMSCDQGCGSEFIASLQHPPLPPALLPEHVSVACLGAVSAAVSSRLTSLTRTYAHA